MHNQHSSTSTITQFGNFQEQFWYNNLIRPVQIVLPYARFNFNDFLSS